jgi:hypothetical protein
LQTLVLPRWLDCSALGLLTSMSHQQGERTLAFVPQLTGIFKKRSTGVCNSSCKCANWRRRKPPVGIRKRRLRVCV